MKRTSKLPQIEMIVFDDADAVGHPKRIHHPAEGGMLPVVDLDPAVETTGAISTVPVL